MKMESVQLGLFGGIVKEKKKPIDSRLTHWAVVVMVSERCYMPSGTVVWGLGPTRKIARENAFNEWHEYDPLEIVTMDDLLEKIEFGEVKVVRCSRRLVREVEDYGGECCFVLVPGQGAFLPKEKQV